MTAGTKLLPIRQCPTPARGAGKHPRFSPIRSMVRVATAGLIIIQSRKALLLASELQFFRLETELPFRSMMTESTSGRERY